MKKAILVGALLVPFAIQAQDNFHVVAKVGGDDAPARAYLLYRYGDKNVIDSTTLVKGSFEFNGPLKEPTPARLIVDHKGVGLEKSTMSSDMTMMYLEKGTVRIDAKDSLKRAVFTGSALNDEYIKYEAWLSVPTRKMAALNQEYRSERAKTPRDTAKLKDIEEQFSGVGKDYKALQRQYIKANPDSYISLMALREVAGAIIDIPATEPLFNSLSQRIKESSAGQEFVELMEKTRAVGIGKQAPEFTQNDVDGKPVKLSDFRGKYVLLDFWASWCVPCRAENPNVVRVYNEYKDRNFTVLSVSLDRPGKKEDWVKAIRADGLTWTQVSDLNFWENKVALLYGIKSVPQNFLLNKEGKIVAVNLRGEELGKTLEGLLK